MKIPLLRLLLLGALVPILVLSSCKSDPTLSPAGLEVVTSEDPITFTWNQSDSKSFDVVTTDQWAILVPAAGGVWCRPSVTNGTGNATVTLNVLPNAITLEERSVVLTVVSGGGQVKTLTITQAGNSSLTIVQTENPMSFDWSQRGDESFEIITLDAWTITVPPEGNWCTVTPTSGTGNDTINVSVNLNITTTEERSVILTVEAANGEVKTLTVTQAGNPSLVVIQAENPVSFSWDQVVGESIRILTPDDWTITTSPGGEWCLVTPMSGTGFATATLTPVSSNSTTTNPRNATLTVTLASGLSKTVSVTQAGNPTFQVVASNPMNFAWDVTATQNITLTTAATWTASVPLAATWCRVTPPSGTGDAILSVSVDPNSSSAQSRTTTIILASSQGDVRAITVIQAGNPALAEVVIPDATFKQYCLTNFDTNNDGVLSYGEAAVVITVDVRGVGTIRTMEGISAFTAMETLYCGGVDLSPSLDVSGLTALKDLRCSNNLSLTSLNVSGAIGLEDLHCDNTGLTSPNISNLPALTYLNCSHNANQTNLTVTNLGALTDLYCNNSALVSLSVSGLSALGRLDCSINTSLAGLNLTGATALNFLNCFNTQITSLDISGSVMLDAVDANPNTSLTTVHVWWSAPPPPTSLTFDIPASTTIIYAP